MKRFRRHLLGSVLGAMTLMMAGAEAWAQVTTVRITDRVLVKDCIRFGINLGGDTYYSGAALVKKRVRENFEGTSYRQCHYGPVQDENGATTWFDPPGEWRKILIGGRYTILSGPAKGTTGIIKDITSRKVEHEGTLKDFACFVFDKKVEPWPPNTGLLVEALRLNEGQFRPLEEHEYWTSHGNKINVGDVPPGSFGVAAVKLDGSQKPAHVRFPTHYQRYGDTNGTWRVRFWARAKSGHPRLTVSCDPRDYGESKDVELTSEWRKCELTLVADKVPEPPDPERQVQLLFLLQVEGGQVLIDDVEIWQQGDENRTAFRDDCVEVLKRFNPGVLRFLQMGGNTLDNALVPPMRAHSFTSRRDHGVGPYRRHNKNPYSLHQMYELCEYLGTEPWYCLPGTLSYEEMEKFMEYLGAPAGVGYGKLRAQLGQRKPWTEVFSHIHVEFGNEAWNNAAPYQSGGYNGPDYWQDLIRIGKGSPYYKANVLFHAAGQAASSYRNRSIMAHVPNADRFGLAPYIIQRLSDDELAYLNTDDRLLRWVFAWPVWRSRDKDGAMFQNYRAGQQAGVELSVYEVNHHITGGDASPEARNKIVTSIGGGLNVAGTMLMMLKEHHIRTQCLFTFIQHGYRARGIGTVRLWGAVLNMRKDRERYRPTFLACMLANKVMGGNLVETVHTGEDPTFDATGIFGRGQRPTTVSRIPCLSSYAFADGSRRGLVLINLSTSRAVHVQLETAGAVRDEAARSWLLTADSVTANNEFERSEPQVVVKEEVIAGFRSGSRVVVPPFSMRALLWELE